jgi:hypothetical protein
VLSTPPGVPEQRLLLCDTGECAGDKGGKDVRKMVRRRNVNT